jgi:hypothetical protein
LAFLTPVQASCNYVTLFFRNIASVLSERVSQGGLLRFAQIAIANLPNAESGPSSTVFPGPAGQAVGPLHVNPYPYTDSPGQPAVCAAGNEPYNPSHPVIGNPPASKLRLSTQTTKKKSG